MHATPDLETIREAVIAVVGDDPDVVAAYLFGSRASDRSKPGSDVDVALLMREGFDYLANYDHVLRMMGELEDRLGVRVDVVHLNRADPVLQREVRMKGRLLWERDRSARIAWVVRSRKLWLDGEHRRRIYREVRARKAKEALHHG